MGRNEPWVARTSNVLPSNSLIHPETLMKVPVHDVAERFAVRIGHVTYMAFDGVEQRLHVEFSGKRFHFLVGAERIPIVLFPQSVREDAVIDFQANAPFEQLSTQVCEERSDSVGHNLLVVGS